MQMAAERGKAEKLLELAAPMYQADIRENVIRQMFAMSFMALHDEFGFGRERIMRWYKKMLSLNHEALASGSKTPLDDLIVALKDEYNFDLNAEMEKINKRDTPDYAEMLRAIQTGNAGISADTPCKSEAE